ncbi:MAG: extracellular solute-binding protein [Spirochaetaceae bacterium]|nr:MAG: extracellular solute-binding protein [Spirochaetaceae bacterium]
MERKIRVITVSLVFLLLLGIATGFSAGKQEEAAAEGPYRFNYAIGVWDLAGGRIGVEKQPADPYFQYVENKLGMAPLTVSWEWEGSTGYVQGLRLAIASGDIPEAFMPRDEQLVKELMEAGAIIPLDDLLKEHGQDVLKAIPEDKWDQIRATAPDGKIYYVSYIRFAPGSRTGFIRKDWLDRVGKTVPKTKDELVDVYRAFRDHDANGNGDPNDEIPVSGRQYMRWCDDLFVMWGVSMWEGFPQWYWDEKQGRLISHQVSDQMKNAIEWLRFLVDEKLMDPVFAIQSNKDWVAKINANRVGHHFHIVNSLHGFAGFMKDDPDAGWVVLHPPRVPGLPQQKNYFPFFEFPMFVISSEARHPDKIMQWFNWGSTLEGNMYRWLGIPEVDWTREDGKIKVLNQAVPRYKYIPYGIRQYVPEAIAQTPLGDMKVKMLEELWPDNIQGLDNEGMPPQVYEDYTDFRPWSATLYREWCSKMVMGELPMSAWDEYVKKWYDSGGEIVTQRATEWYKNFHGIK